MLKTVSPGGPQATPWHVLTPEDAARKLGTDVALGLSAEQLLASPPPLPIEDAPAWRLALQLFVSQCKGTVILVLTGASVAFWFLGHRNDSLGIFISILFAVVLGFLTDFRSQRALAALKSLSSPTATVLRGGVLREIATSLLAKGDVAVLHAGSTVPADGRLIDAMELSISEALLTGESAPRAKSIAAAPADAALAERTCMAYAGTTVTRGFGRMLVTNVGLDTELGRIGGLVRALPKEETPLEIQVESLGRRLAVLVLGLSIIVTLIGLLNGQSFSEMLETGFLLAIAAIPEGLPAVYTVALAGGVARMVRSRVLVRRFSAVEVLGCVDIVCTDKTGTLTENVMRVCALSLPHRSLIVTGTGYAPDGEFLENGAPIKSADIPELSRLLLIAALCNNAALESHEGWHIHGTPTEGALLTLAVQGGLDLEALRSGHHRLSESAFDSVRKRMSVIVEDRNGKRWSLVKGAPAVILPLCVEAQFGKGNEALDEAMRERLLVEAQRLGADGLRVLAFALRELVPDSTAQDAETQLVWVGMAGLFDPPRAAAARSVEALRAAGVRTIMLTGDQSATAEAIARRIGLRTESSRRVDGAALALLLAKGTNRNLADISVFSRVTPGDKLALVRALRESGFVVAMTGDGVNDAPALKAADIGVAMGSASSDVAKEAADIVVTDADYSTLVAAVSEGRRIYSNLRRAARFLLLCSLANIGLMLGSVLLRTPLTMTALQILWLNLVVHIFPGIALALAPNTAGFMDAPPRRRNEPLLPWREIAGVVPHSALLAAAAFGVFATEFKADLPLARTSAMAALGVGLLLQMFSALDHERNGWSALRGAGIAVWLAFAAGLTVLGAMLYWPTLGSLLGTTPLTAAQWLPPMVAAGSAHLVLEGAAALARLQSSRKNAIELSSIR